MDRPDDLEQRLWEFVYDLLPQDEAAALRRRIAAEADVARLHDDVRRKAAILAQAAQLELPPIPLVQPVASVSASSRRWINWAVALAASLLLCYLGFAGFRTRSLERSVAGGLSGMSWAEQPVRTVVFGPPAVQPSLANYIAVQTQTATGVPRAAAVNYRVLGDDGTLLTSGQCQSDASGFAQFNFRASPPSGGLRPQPFQNVHLELEPQTDAKTVLVRRTLPVATRELTTYLSADKTIYRPGERVRCRTVTLNRADLEVVREGPVEFRILDAAGQPLNGARQVVPSQHGVAFAEFELPQFQPGGTHTLVASSPTDAFSEERRKFEVRPYVTPALRQKLDFARDSYKLGDEVEADLTVELADGSAARQVPLAVAAEAGGVNFFNLHTMTNDQGSHRLRFRLPETIDAEAAVLSVTAGKEAKNRILEPIPIHRGTVGVEFFPESGELVHDVSNRVYFFAHDAQEKPVHIQGRVVDGQGGEVVAVQTIHDGRGVFAFQPQRGQNYRLELDSASDAVEQPDLPPVSERQFLALNAAPGVFAAGQPLKVRLLTNAERPVAVSAACRGVVVGQELVSPTVFQRESAGGGVEMLVPVADTAEGVIRLTAYDYGVQPPMPVAERLVFRRPVRKLAIQADQAVGPHQPGDSVQWTFSVRNERGRPLSAVLGASVVDETALSLVRDRSASLTTHFWLTGQIDDVRGLEDANLYLAEGAQAEQALDLLLGTQGWRRFVRVPADQLAQTSAAGQERDSYVAALDSTTAAAVAVSDAPAVLADNAAEAAEMVRGGLAALQTGYEQTVRRVGRVLIVGSLILAVMLGLLAVMRRLPATTVWMPALGTSAMCLVLGAVWFVTESRPTQRIAKVSVAPPASAVPVAQADQRTPLSRLQAATPASKPESGKADTEASNRWYLVENVAGKDGSQAGSGPTATEAAPAADDAGMPADKFKALPPVEEAEERKDSDSSRFGLQDKPRFDEAEGLPSRKGSLADRVAPMENLQQDMPEDESRAQSLDAPRSLTRDAGPTRGALAGRAAGVAGGPGEPSRRLKGAPPAAPVPADMDAVQAPAEPAGAVQAPFAAPAAGQPAPAAAPMLPAASEPEQPQAALVEVLAASPAKESMPSQLRLEKK
nr:MG2 domain-containing protein [Pirellulaceae bacterium]